MKELLLKKRSSNEKKFAVKSNDINIEISDRIKSGILKNMVKQKDSLVKYKNKYDKLSQDSISAIDYLKSQAKVYYSFN